VSPTDLPIFVGCEAIQDGFRCRVRVGDDAGATHHDVRVRQADLGHFSFEETEPETLVRESFRFLLEREPRESILPRFELTVIARYFPDYPIAIRRRLGAGR